MGNRPVGHAVRVVVEVDGQHSRDLGWATDLLGMLLELMLMLMASIVEILDGQPTCWAMDMQSPGLSVHSVSVCSCTSHSTKSSSSSGRRMLKTPSHLQIEFGGPPYRPSSLLPSPPPILCPLHSNAAHLVPPVHDCRPREVFYVYSFSNLSVQTVWM